MPTILGLENEYTVGVPPGKRALVPVLLAQLIEALHRGFPSVRCTEVAGAPGLMLGNGSRIYVDGLRLESATPEVRTPEEVLACQRANELMILQALPEAAKLAGFGEGEVRVSRIVTDYGSPTPKFAGQHINVLTARYAQEELIESLVPFLVTRYYAVAGGWGATGFVMSQKASAYRCVASPDTREQRGIVAINKNENLAPPPLKRMHLTFGDALLSELGTYLSVGCTALLCRMWDDGVCVGPAFALQDPLRALRQLDSDPTWARPLLRLKCGRETSGLEIQLHFLTAAERYVGRGGGNPWMQQVVKRWRATWEALRQGPKHLAASLDPFIKRALYGQMLAERGLSLEDFGIWCATLALIEPHLNGTPLPRRRVHEHLGRCLPRFTFDLITDRVATYGLQWDRLSEMRSLLDGMKTIDLRYHDIAEDGLYWRLRAQGICNSGILTEEDIAQAMNLPTTGTRAQARGKAICEAWRDSSAHANWMMVASSRGTMQLPDPFASEGQWTAPAQT